MGRFFFFVCYFSLRIPFLYLFLSLFVPSRKVTIQLYDWDFKWNDDYCGNLFISLNDLEVPTYQYISFDCSRPPLCFSTTDI